MASTGSTDALLIASTYTSGNGTSPSPTDAMAMDFTPRIIEACVLSLIATTALIGNTSLWMVICRDRALRTTSNGLILCLSAADLMVSAINMPVTVAAILYGRWMLSDMACVAFGFITMTTFIASVMSLGMISINRFVLICYPVHFKVVYTQSRTSLIVFGTWLLSVSLASPPLFGWGEYDYLPGQSFCFCNWTTSFSYTIFMVAACFGGPCTVMTICYVGILRKVRESRRKVRTGLMTPERRLSQTSNKLRPGKKTADSKNDASINNDISVIRSAEQQDGGGSGGGGGSSGGGSGGSASGVGGAGGSGAGGGGAAMSLTAPNTVRVGLRRGHQEDLRLTATLLVVIFVFVICWLPFCVTMFLSVFSPYPVPRAADITTLLLGCVNSSCNPIIYGIMNKRFWDGYKRLFCSLCRRCRVRPHGSSSAQSDELENTGNKSWRQSLQ